MVFAYDVEAALTSTAVLVNTLPELSQSGEDEMASIEQLDEFLLENRYTGSRDGSTAELEAVRSVRAPLRSLWRSRAEEDLVAVVNGMLEDGRALPQLVRHGIFGWHLHATRDESPLATRIVVEAAMGFVDVIRGDERDRIRICAADDCEAVLVDFSRNRSKRYCDTGNCGNRANVAAYRARRASS
ncbi:MULTISPECIES: CGNR zinc finger domain-containing protein [unclassified Rathayibacter]|jgi:predicted RNA-binding Zn ribbon-like protein|uniref:CGNR zinc finger domain-containing protein n=1 Tax=unclassified Rathayibacter TaxID=2609250 RepID=UPI000F4AAD7E|nr:MULTISPECIES: CGNR zinc finger domain-containing protein [unclassified Rathayibacter]MCJ1674978.1 CGNR zinc finger domain-containing protein [Rathayibacter sp. VKM Ac-2929]MCJ1681763.1 CGNR zinc finger domain-containing protein [Rathayibacter sp. VKM Ac-2928]MCJ1686305.1 CGNR zinc finger domain-containing protein [Rathayibacter sp. VKM Ac-2927]ROQ15764.1 putative RNA-binding Zn ribbon-like protein [Rathayibacter sp. PhB93]TDQ15703.1 putative RNA-binding Zn ribbon-like protein [Rathayibacter